MKLIIHTFILTILITTSACSDKDSQQGKTTAQNASAQNSNAVTECAKIAGRDLNQDRREIQTIYKNWVNTALSTVDGSSTIFMEKFIRSNLEACLPDKMLLKAFINTYATTGGLKKKDGYIFSTGCCSYEDPHFISAGFAIHEETATFFASYRSEDPKTHKQVTRIYSTNKEITLPESIKQEM
ncbi:MAG: hypothetical protein OEZ39_08475 [Gammaproteobacteria bacterium]|nr:hypothetical protein [Gammaproteobacteria bacterium]MDH5651897.1 hypothetical protein [Gammaproteobacteria bacterium]